MKKTPTLFMLSVPAALAVACALALPGVSPADTPDAYLDYVESTGSQYIDTGVNLCSNDTVVAEYIIPNALTKTVDLFGVHKHGLTARYVFSYDSNSGSSTIDFHRANASQGATTTKTGVTVTPGARQTVTMKIGPGTSSIVSASGESLYSATLTTATVKQDATGSLAIFGCNSSQYGFMALCPARLYSLRIYDENGSLAHNFLPCKKFDAAGLYDKATGRILFATGDEDLVAGPVLPRPAELVEWVQSDGSSGDRHLYIDTGVVAKNDMTMAAEMEWVEKPSAQSTFCGASNNVSFLTLYTSAGTHQCGYSTSSQYQIGGGGNAATAGVRFRILSALVRSAQSLEVWALNGASAGYYGQRTNTSKEWVNLKIPLYIFARNDAGTPNQFAHARLYSLSLTNEIGVVRDFIPCVADNGRAGLYDRVSERVFFPQAAVEGATPDFDFASEVGAVTNAPATTKWPLLRPEWIEANGTNDYVNLGIMARDGTRMLAEVEWNAIPAAGTFCGAATNSSTALFTTYRVTPEFHRMGYYNGSSTLGGGNPAPVAGVRYRVETSLASGEQIITVAKQENGAWVPVGAGTRTANLSFPAGFANLNLPLYLFARNFSGVPDEFAPARLYSFKLWQGGALVRDLCPAFDPADNAPALFDKVSKRYFRNAGGYRLTAGGATSAFPGAGTFWVIK